MMSQKDLKKVMMVLSVMGALLSMYLLYTTLSQDYGLCPSTGCEVVGTSQYSYFLGVPVAFWGLGYYLVLFLLLAKMFGEEAGTQLRKYLGWLLFVGVLFTLYLRYLEFFVLKAICFWCWGSVLIILLLVIAYFFSKKKE